MTGADHTPVLAGIGVASQREEDFRCALEPMDLQLRERLLSAGAEPTPSDPAAFAALVKRQLEVWGRKVRDAGIQPE